VLLLPALIFIGFIGWLMYSMGSPRRSKPKQRKNEVQANTYEQKDGVTFMPATTLDEKLNEDEEIIQ
jgi:hypothetical protein